MLTVHVMFKSNQENYLDIANQIKKYYAGCHRKVTSKVGLGFQTGLFPICSCK